MSKIFIFIVNTAILYSQNIFTLNFEIITLRKIKIKTKKFYGNMLRQFMVFIDGGHCLHCSRLISVSLFHEI
jgi:hypothetical protein